MKQERWDLLIIMRAAMAGKQIDLPELTDQGAWEKIFLSAEANQVLPLIMETAKRCGAPESVLALYRRQAMRLMVRQTMRMHYVQRLCAFLQERKLPFIALDGVLCGALYPRAEQYVSAEERFFIRGEDMARFHEALLAFGMTTETPEADLSCVQSVVYASRDRQVHVELSNRLLSLEETCAAKCFPDILGDAVTEQIGEASIPAPGYTDRLLYQLLAARQDYAQGVLCLRRVSDTLLLARRYGEKIDWERIASGCETVGAADFAGVLFEIGRKDLGIDVAALPETFRQAGGDAEALRSALLEKSGSREARRLNSYEYLSALRAISTEGGEVRLFVSGGSMTPFLIHRRDSVYFRKPDQPLKRGDIVFFQRDSGQFVLHRILRVHGTEDAPLYDIVGDGQTQVERNVRRDQIFGLVLRAERKGKVLTPKSLWWKFFAGAWLRLLPLRPLLVKLYAALRGNRAAQSGENENK